MFTSSPVPVPCKGFEPTLHICLKPSLWLHFTESYNDLGWKRSSSSNLPAMGRDLLWLLTGLWMDPGPGSSLATSRAHDRSCHLALALPAMFRCCGTASLCWVSLTGSPQPGPAAPWQISPWVGPPHAIGQLVPVLSLTFFFLVSTQYFSCCTL